MTDPLVDLVLQRADADAALDAEAQLLILAALDGEESLDLVIDEGAPDAGPDGTDDTDGIAPALPAEPAKAYLTSIEVQGFRGIGPAAKLSLTPGPGLTVIAGRNGCGKSSFAEALEVALTTNSYRWRARKSTIWRDAWRNLHAGTSASITVTLAEQSAGKTTVRAEWGDPQDFADVTVWTQRHGQKRGTLSDLGWDEALNHSRPFLSYDELGAMFAEPSKLHDALLPVLGLERLDDALTLLTKRHKELGAHATAANARKKEVLAALVGVNDARADAVRVAVSSKVPDVVAAAALATGATSVDPALAVLRRLASLTAPDVAPWREARSRLDAAEARRVEAVEQVGQANAVSTRLLEAALEHRDLHGDGACPVCGQGTLDSAWAENARSAVQEAGIFGAAVAEAESAVTSARGALTRCMPAPDPDLVAVAARDDLGVPTAAPAAAAWQALHAAATDSASSALDVEARAADLTALVPQVAAEASAAVAAREDAWRPVALVLAHWVEEQQAAARNADAVAQLSTAKAWLTKHIADLRNERLAPLSDKAREIWSLLRQESNVDLGGLTLEGTNTRRRVGLQATVDGTDAGAFAVMSQGELHALTLALFLPRATAAESPFGFLVIDDPVQAMDPAKVDGLAQVLASVAEHRQVVVLTHDDRLPDAVRRLALPARILEISRDAQSVVTVSSGSEPAARYLDDARAVASDKAVTEDVAARVVPEMCRLALEAACRDLYYRREFLAGRSRHDVEVAWEAAKKTSHRLALVLHGAATTSLTPWLDAVPRRKRALGICASAPHQGLHGNPHNAISDVAETITELVATHG